MKSKLNNASQLPLEMLKIYMNCFTMSQDFIGWLKPFVHQLWLTSMTTLGRASRPAFTSEQRRAAMTWPWWQTFLEAITSSSFVSKIKLFQNFCNQKNSFEDKNLGSGCGSVGIAVASYTIGWSAVGI